MVLLTGRGFDNPTETTLLHVESVENAAMGDALTGTPSEISEKILELCRGITPGTRPLYLDITPEPWCKPADCFENIRRKIERDGGTIQCGWAIWEWPRVFVEAEHHAVYSPGSGTLWIDLTPCQQGNSRRLFLPDDNATYDFEDEGFRRDNVRLALSDDPDVRNLFKTARRRSDFYNGLPGVGRIVLHASEDKELAKLERAVANAIAVLKQKYAKG